MSGELIAGRYRLDSLLGRGGMSEVWAADDQELGRRVALKLLAPDADRARFDREARAAASLAHPNITQLYDYGEADGRPYMVLEYLSGGTLEDRLARGVPLPDGETDQVAREVAAGLAHAHGRGLVHRDLKPANILFDAEDRAKIADFGIARLSAGGTFTEAGTVLGTAAYISPEQASGDVATPASDVYSFGVMLYRMLTGRLPFEAEQPLELVALHQTEPPPPVTSLRPEAPARLEGVATATLAKDPLDRPPDGAALLAELGGAPATTTYAPAAPAADVTRVLTRPAAAPATGVVAPPRPPRRRGIGLLPVAVGILVLAAAGAAIAYAVGRPEGHASPTTDSLPRPVTTLSTTKRHPTTQATTAPAAPATTAAPTTTQAATTHRTTTHRTTTAPAPTVSPPPTTVPVTTAPPPTTAPATTTAPVTTVP